MMRFFYFYFVAITVLLTSLSLFFLATLTFFDGEKVEKLGRTRIIGIDSSQHKKRGLIIVPYLNNYPPVWLQSFLISTNTSKDALDWIIFYSTGVATFNESYYDVPSNVRMLPLNFVDFAKRIVLALHNHPSISIIQNSEQFKEQLDSLVKFLKKYPYVLVEFKPMLGLLFQDHLNSSHYTHWGYGDLDILAGNISHFFIYNDHDIINFTFGDHFSLYLRAQLVIFRHNIQTLHLWQNCSYFSSLFQRLHDYYDHNGWHLQSAEGCISKVVLDHSNLSVIYIPNQLSDAFVGRLSDREIMIKGSGNFYRCYGVSYEKRNVFDMHSNGNLLASKAVQRSDMHCSYWIDPRYDVCTVNVSGGSIISKDGHKNIWYHEWERNYNICIQGAFVHFQSWKRNYFLFTVSAMEFSGAHALDGVLSEFGFIVTQHNHHSKIHRKERNSCISFYSSFGNCEEFVSFHSMSLVTDSTLDHEELTIIAISTLDRSYGIFSSIAKLKDVEIILALQIDSRNISQNYQRDLERVRQIATTNHLKLLEFDLLNLKRSHLLSSDELYDKLLFNSALRATNADWVLIMPENRVLSPACIDLIQPYQDTPRTAVIFVPSDRDLDRFIPILQYLRNMILHEPDQPDVALIELLPMMPTIFNRRGGYYDNTFIRFPSETMGISCYDWLFYVSLFATGYNIKVEVVHFPDVGFNKTLNGRCIFEKSVGENEYRRFAMTVIKYFRRLRRIRMMRGNVYSKNNFGRLVANSRLQVPKEKT